jgi:hypothetical protein
VVYPPDLLDKLKALEKVLEDLGLHSSIGSADMSMCQQIGGAVQWLDHDAMLVPSARADGWNLIIFAARRRPSSIFEVIGSELIEESTL